MTTKPPMTVEEVVALAKRKGEIQVNPLRWRKDRVTSACFQAAKLGLLEKQRINAGLFIFKTIKEPK